MTLIDLALEVRDFEWLKALLDVEKEITPTLKECAIGYVIFFEGKNIGVIDTCRCSVIVDSAMTIGEVEFIVADLFLKEVINDSYDLVIIDELQHLELI